MTVVDEIKNLPSDSFSALITIRVTFCVVLSIWLCRFLLRSLALLSLLFLLLWILVLWQMMSLWLLYECARLIPVIRASLLPLPLPLPPPTDASSSESSDATITTGDKSPDDLADELPCELCFECDEWWWFDWNMCWRPSRKWSVRLDGLTTRFDGAPWFLLSYRAGNDSFCFRDKHLYFGFYNCWWIRVGVRADVTRERWIWVLHNGH